MDSVHPALEMPLWQPRFVFISRSCVVDTSGLTKPQTHLTAGLVRGVRLIKRHAQGTENRMTVFLAIETSEPSGLKRRIALGCTLTPALVWMAVSLIRLF